MATTSASKTPIIHRRLYRALLRAVKPFTPPSPDAAVLSSLLHRSFIPLEIDEKLYARRRGGREEQSYKLDYYMVRNYDDFYPEHDDDEEDDIHTPKRYDDHFILFRRLLWMVFSDEYNSKNRKNTVRCYQYPNYVKRQPQKLREVIRREFRVPEIDPTLNQGYFSSAFPVKARRETAFLALRKLNEKLAWMDQLVEAQSTRTVSPKQAAKYVEPVTLTGHLERNLSSVLQTGTFLVAHPHLNGYFRRSVICILQHGNGNSTGDNSKNGSGNQENPSDDSGKKGETAVGDEGFGTYGVVVNRSSIDESTNRNRTLKDILNFLPEDILAPFGSSPIKEGGPVQMPSVQMMHTCSVGGGRSENDERSKLFLEAIGGTLLPPVSDRPDDKDVSFRGDITKAAEAVTAGYMDREDVSFFIGATCWYPGQLEKEIKQGCWLLCRGPPEIALTGVCDHEPTNDCEVRPKADLWLSMMCALGEDEARLAHLTEAATEDDVLGAACDDFH